MNSITITEKHHHFDDATTKIAWIFLRYEVIEKNGWNAGPVGLERFLFANKLRLSPNMSLPSSTSTPSCRISTPDKVVWYFNIGHKGNFTFGTAGHDNAVVIQRKSYGKFRPY